MLPGDGPQPDASCCRHTIRAEGARCMPSAMTAQLFCHRWSGWQRLRARTRCRRMRRTGSRLCRTYRAAHGPNAIFQFRFDAETGRITPNSPARVEMDGELGPRHFCFHPSKDILYFSDEQGCSVTGYNFDSENGTLSAISDDIYAARGVHGAQ